MFDDNFKWIGDARKVNRPIPFKKLRQIDEKPLNLLVGEVEIELMCGCKKELAQSTLMFHVEQLRETPQEVKACFRMNGCARRWGRPLHQVATVFCTCGARRAKQKWRQE